MDLDMILRVERDREKLHKEEAEKEKVRV